MNIAFIPARGGSKSIPLKNIKLFHGKPLIWWNLKQLEDASVIDKVIVATDSEIIAQTVLSFGFSKVTVYNRDPKNAEDSSPTEDVMQEFINANPLNDMDLFFLVQLTSPFTTSTDFENAYKLFVDKDADSLLTCTTFKRFLWSKDGKAINYDYRKRPRRQDFEGYLLENGAFYITRVKSFKASLNRLSGKIVPYVMDDDRCAIEIDEPIDWEIAENLKRLDDQL